MPNKYRVAVIGRTGKGNYGHGLDVVWQALDNIEIVAVADEKDRQPFGNMYDGRAALEMILAVYDSHRSRGPVELPLRTRQHPLSLL